MVLAITLPMLKPILLGRFAADLTVTRLICYRATTQLHLKLIQQYCVKATKNASHPHAPANICYKLVGERISPTPPLLACGAILF